MAAKRPGESFVYEYEDTEYLATVQNTYTDEDTNEEMATLSLSGTEIIVKVENNF